MKLDLNSDAERLLTQLSHCLPNLRQNLLSVYCRHVNGRKRNPNRPLINTPRTPCPYSQRISGAQKGPNHAESEGKEGEGEDRDSRRGQWMPKFSRVKMASTSGERIWSLRVP